MFGPINLQQLTTFATVLTEGSMTAAGNKLQLTQPAVSQQIRNLEQELGAELLERGTKQIKPTAPGQLLFDYSKKILSLSQQMRVALNTMGHEATGSVTISTINSLGIYLVSPIIGNLLQNNPSLKISLKYGSYKQVASDMRTGKTDIGLLPDLRTEAGFELSYFKSELLFSDDIWCVASNKDTTITTSVELKDLANRPCVMYSDSYPQFLRLFQKQMQAEQLDITPVFTCDNVGTIKKVIESNMGWGFLPAHCIRKQVRSRRLQRIYVKNLDYATKIFMYSSEKSELTELFKVLYLSFRHQALSG